MGDYYISEKDRLILRDLAKKQLEYSELPEMKELTKLWYRHNDLKGERPMVSIEIGTFLEEIRKELKCETETGRQIEEHFNNTFLNYEVIGDDSVIPPMYGVNYGNWFVPFNLNIEVEYADHSLGHIFKHKITDLEKDFPTLEKSLYGSRGKEEATKWKKFLEDVFGDILPVEFVGSGLYSVPTQDIVHMMGMENMFLSIYDCPDTFHKFIGKLTDEYAEYHIWLQKEGLLLPTTSYGWVAQGSCCFTNDLYDGSDPSRQVTVNDVWGFMDSQETTGMSPEMYDEFIFPYYKKISDMFGLFSYGCCEAVDGIYDLCLSKCENLRKISISPWCNEEFMGERLKGSKTIFHRKPSPNFLGVGYELDEDGWRKHILKTIKAAKGCKLEITQRDVYTLSGNIPKARKAVEIIRELIEDNWE